MWAYDLRLAMLSIRRNPLLAALLVGGIALGIAVASTFVTLRHVVAGDPIPDKSDQLFYVRLDNWDPVDPWDRVDNLPPDQVTWRDAMALLESLQPTRAVASFKSVLVVHPEDREQRPYREVVRMTGADFFAMFDVPFQFGAGWDPRSDEALDPVVVIDHETNSRLFGGEDSVGRNLRIQDRTFRVVGVLAEWRPTPKFYDPLNGGYQEPEGIYMPIGFVRPLDARTAGNSSSWGNQDNSTLDGLLASETSWIQLWVELPDQASRAAFAAHLDAYVHEQKKLGRFPRPLNNRLQSVMELLDSQEVVPEETHTMRVIALLFLAVSAVNLIGILLGKFLTRANEVGIRRALGASRAAVFRQHLLECEVLALAGGLLGLAIAAGLTDVVGGMFVGGADVHLDLEMVATGIALALAAGLVAGIYPAWRICKVPPASYLKLQ